MILEFVWEFPWPERYWKFMSDPLMIYKGY